MVVPEPAAGWREGRVDAPGRGEGEGGVASEISREKFLGMGDAGSGPSWWGWGAHPSGLGTALAHPRTNTRTARVLETRIPMIARLESGAESSRCYPFICSFSCSAQF
jgi:hypothetical protein